MRKSIALGSICTALLLCAEPSLGTPSTSIDEQDSALKGEILSAAEPICDLHVWPANNLRLTYSDFFRGGRIDDEVAGRDGDPTLPSSPLSTERQVQILRDLPLAEGLGLAGYSTIIHEHPLDSRKLRRSKERFAPTASACYAELALDDVFYQEDVVSGKYLKALFRFRSFDGDSLTRRFGAYSQVKLKLFPPATPKERNAALDELTQAYKQAIVEFGEALNKSPKKKRGK